MEKEPLILWRTSLNRTKLLYVGIGLMVITIVAFSAVFYLTQNNRPKTAFEILPIATPQYEVGLDKPAAYINISVKNDGDVNQTNVVVKLSGGFSNSSNEVPDQLFWVVTKNISVISPGETVTMPRIFDFGWYYFYRIEVSSADGTKEVFDQWVQWRSWDLPVPSG
jgi:hypothetical protein